MRNFLIGLKEKLGKEKEEAEDEEKGGEDYLELKDTSGVSEEERGKVIVRPFVLTDFEDIKPVLNSLREGYTIALVNIKALRDKDIVELKRAINKLKKTTEAIDGDIAGFGEDYVVVVPSFAAIHRTKETEEVEE